MIELVSQDRCIKCDLCVQVCPTNVFDAIVDAAPTIARQADCQTCFMCEAYCPVDALYVAPFSEQQMAVDERALADASLLGSYRRSIGWSPGTRPPADPSFKLMGG